MNAFYCYTPVHIMMSINMKEKLYKDKKCDIYIFNTFKNYNHIVNNIIKENIFDNVYLIDDLLTDKNKIFKIILKNSKLHRSISNKLYENLYFFNLNQIVNTIVVNEVRKKNKKVNINYCQDTPGIYKFSLGDWNKKLRILFKLLDYKNPKNYINAIYISYHGHLNIYEEIKIMDMPNISKEDFGIKDKINRVFGYNNESLDDIDIIIFEESFYKDGLIGNEDFKIFNIIKDIFKDKRIALKLHPRTEINRFINSKGLRIIENQHIPWEVFCLNSELENKILISLSCASMTAPKILFDNEPYLIYMYNLVEDSVIKKNGQKYYDEEYLNILNYSKEIYNEKDRVLFVKDIEEIRSLYNK